MELDRGSGVALWRQVEDILAKEIQSTDCVDPLRLPAEGELAARFGVNRHTVRQALASLQDKGLVQIEQGRGTFVVAQRIAYVLGARTRFTENIARLSRRPSARLLRAYHEPATGDAADALRLRPGTRVGVIDTARDADGRRFSVSVHYYPIERFPNLADGFGRLGSLTEALRDHGVADYRRASTWVTSQLPTTEDARFLHISRNRPVLVSESVDVDMNGDPVLYTVTRFVGDLVQIEVDHASIDR